MLHFSAKGPLLHSNCTPLALQLYSIRTVNGVLLNSKRATKTIWCQTIKKAKKATPEISRIDFYFVTLFYYIYDICISSEETNLLLMPLIIIALVNPLEYNFTVLCIRSEILRKQVAQFEVVDW